MAQPPHSTFGHRRLRLRALPGPLALVITAALALAACGSSGHANSGKGTGGSSGGANTVLQVATSQVPTSLDPCQGNGGFDQPYIALLYSPLIFSVPTTGQLEPGIAQSWSFSGPNKLTFTMNLKSGLTFQDGTPVDAAAVASSIKRCLSLGVQSVPTIKNVSATGPSTVTIDLSAPTAGLPGILSSRVGMIVSPTAAAKYGKNLGNHPVGAGPYMLTSYVPNSTVDFARYDGYKPAGEPAAKLKGIDVQIISNPTALTNAITSGTVQYAFGVDANAVSVIKKQSNLSYLINDKSLAYTDLVINQTLKPMDNQDVRLAMNYAIDRSAMAKAASNGVFTQPAFQPYPKGNPYHDPAMENAWPYNPTKAKQLLAQAGYPNGLTVTGITISGPPFQTDATIAAADLAKVGIKVNFTSEAGPAAVSGFAQHNAGQLFSVGWDATNTPYLTYFGLFSSQSYYAAGHIGTPGVDALIEKLNTDYTDADVKTDLAKINQLIKNDPPYVPLYNNPDIDVFDTSVHGADQAASLIGEPDMNFLSVS